MKIRNVVRGGSGAFAILWAVSMLLPATPSYAGPGSASCEITFNLDDAASLGALQFDVDYSATGGSMDGVGNAASCFGLAGGLLARNDDDMAESLALAYISLDFMGPGGVLTCDFTGPSVPSPADFVVSLIDSHTTDFTTGGGNLCAAPMTGSSPPYSRDALVILKNAVGLPVACDLCECDTNNSTTITAVDSLNSLKAANGQAVVLMCPACVGPPVVSAAGASVSVSVSVDCSPCGDGVPDVGEECDDGNNVAGDCCAADCTYEAISSFCDNGDACTGDTCDGLGSCVAGTGAAGCDDGVPCTVDTCSGSCIHTFAPQPACVSGDKSSVQVSDNVEDSKDSIKWKLSGGPLTVQGDLGNPTAATTYTLCVFDSTAGADSLATSLTIASGASWTDKDPKGFAYKDTTAASDGVVKASLKTGAIGKTKLSVAAKGLNVPMPAPASAMTFFNQQSRVTVELHNDTTARCWSSQYTTATTNTLTKFKAKTP